MVIWIIVAVLAAFGALCAIWALFGFLLPGQRGAAVVCLCRDGAREEPLIRHCRWLQDLGLVRGPMLLIDGGMTEENRARLEKWGRDIEICTMEELPSRLEQERNRLG